jgi:membrane glycosyltransferase
MNDVACWRRVALRRRLLLAALVAGQTTVGLVLFSQNLQEQAGSWATTILLMVFGVLFAWIGIGFWTAVFGFLALRPGGDPWSLSSANTGHARSSEPGNVSLAPTAVVLPIYHEPVQRTLAGLRAVFEELAQQKQAEAVDFYVLSDSRDPEIWLEEQATCDSMRVGLGAHQRLFYRRRRINQNYKSGNIADFLRRWGQKYRYMIVLDADSLLSASCITQLIELMENRPQAGIIQTAPRLARAQTRFARLQQFANRCYGRLYGAGLAAIQLGDAAYWGHNAIVRVAPFMRHCGLRKLQGPGLFNGPVLSHDFIEAALMGRAGYEVWLEPAIDGSYEESPPTIEDDLTRDRRWCRGNLQHLWLLATLRKLRFAHRMALATGVLSYLASPLWLVFLGLSGYVALATADPAPALPGILANGSPGSGAGIVLIAMTALMLFGPRILALTDLALTKRAEQFGGARRVLTSTIAETLVALALAPLRMLAHTLYVVRALINLDLSWQGQNRSGNTDLPTSFRRFGLPMALAAVTLGLVQWQAPGMTPWALPVILPVLLAPFSANWLNAVPASQPWLPVPEDQDSPPVIDRARLAPAVGKRWAALSWVEHAVLSHAQAPDPGARNITGEKQKTLNRLVDRCAEGGKSALNHFEMSLICSHPAALRALHLRAWNSRSGSPWHQALARMARLPEPQSPSVQPVTARQPEESLWIDAAS